MTAPRRFFLFLLFILTPLSSKILAQGSDPALDSYYAANALYNKNLFELSIDEYRAFIARYPTHEKILHAKFGLAFSLYNLQRYREAEQLLRELAGERETPKKEKVHNFWGQCLLILGDYPGAEQAFLWSVNRGKERLFLDLPGMGAQYQEAPEIASTSIQDLDPLERAMSGLIESLFRQAKWDDVATYCSEFIEMLPESGNIARVRFFLGFAKYELRMYEDAAAILEDVKLYHKATQFYEHAVFLLGVCNEEMGNYEVAAKNHEIVAREVKQDFAGDSLFRLGFVRFSQRDYPQAIVDFEDLRILYPSSEYFDQAGIYLGRAHLESGDYAAAQEIFGKLTIVEPVAAEATIWLARTFLRQENYQQTIDVVRPALRRFNNSDRLHQFVFEYGSALLGLKQYRQASELFNRVVTEFEESILTPQALRLQAFSLMSDEDHVASLAVADQFLQRFPNDPSYRDVAFMRAENIYFLERLDEAVRAYQQFVPWERRTEYTDEARFRIIQIYAEQQKWDQAIDDIYELRQNGNIDGEFFEQLDYVEGLTYSNLQRWDDAIGSFERFIREDSKRLNGDIAQIKLAQAYESKKEFAKARAILEILIQDQPESEYYAQALANLGRLVYNEEDYPLAQTYFEQIATQHKTSPFFAQAQYYLGWIAMEDNNLLKAIGFFDRVAKDYPDNDLASDSLYKQALLYLEMDQPGNAQIAFQNFLNRYPNDDRFDQAAYYHARSLSILKRYTEAVNILKGLLGRTQDADLSARAIYELAWCHQGLASLETAKARYEDLLRLHPNHDLAKRANFELAELEYEEENFDGAIARLDELLAGSLPEDLRERVINRMGWCLLGREQDLAAAETFEQLLRDFPDSEFNDVAAYQAGEVRLMRKEYQRALALFEKARSLAKSER
ncbi:MAG: tetratricopeptide repeat protein, partial [Opitutales bacterium]|nr:tetratricopeptide repeat protein [Opitutales bacterium]